MDACDILIYGAKMGRREVEEMTINKIIFFCERYNRYMDRQSKAAEAGGR